MPPALDPADKKILTLAAGFFLLLLVAALLFAPPSQEASSYPSSYGTDSGGAKAAYLLLKDLGYRIERWEQPATALPPDATGSVFILASPFIEATAAEKQAIRRFAYSGGTILASGMSAAPLLPSLDDPLRWSHCGYSFKVYRALLPTPVAEGARNITLGGSLCWKLPQGATLALYGDKDGVVVVTQRIGKGRVYWWTSATPLTNVGLRETGNLPFFLNSLGPPATTRIFWDEYYHGRQGSLASYFGRTPLPWGLAQLALFFLAACLAYARRHGPLRPPRVESRLSPLEYVETVGDLYRCAHAATTMVELAYQRFHFLMTRHFGLSAHATVEELYSSATRRLGRAQPELFAVLRRCQRARPDTQLSEEDALQLVQALHDYSRLLHITPLPARKET